MIPNCEGCKVELEEGIRHLRKGYDVCFDGLEERKHLLIAVLDKEGNFILY
ncbi:MAG: hypothetical protein AABY15_00665 [Nanoarchaeota archaeon]